MSNYNCTPASKLIIGNYLLSLGKSKLQDIDATEAEHLIEQIQPKCHSGHVINVSTYGGKIPLKCNSKRSGGMCMQLMYFYIYCSDQGFKGTKVSHFFACAPCAFWGQ